MTAIIHSLDLKWPFYVDNYFEISSKFSSAADVISIDCILNDYEIKENKLYVKTVVILVFPALIILFISFVALIIRYSTKKSQINRIYISIVVISIFLQPTILQMLFNNLSYTTLNNVSYLTKELNSKFDDNHIKWVKTNYYFFNIFIKKKDYLFHCSFFNFLGYYIPWILSCYFGNE